MSQQHSMRVPAWLQRLCRWAVARLSRLTRSSVPERMLRWFLLLWLVLIYARELLFMYGLDVPKKLYVLAQCLPFAAQPQICPPDVTFSLLEVSPLALVLFTLLIIVQAVFMWAGLSGAVPRRFYRLYFLEEALLYALSGSIAGQAYVVLSLYLALILAAIGVLKQGGPVILVAAVYGLPFLYFYFVYTPTQERAAAGQTGLFGLADYLVLPLFVIGYLALYAQQLRAHAQLAAYAQRVEELTLAAERQRMARELHDTLAQGLVGLTLQLETIDALLSDEESARAQELVRVAMRRARGTMSAARATIDDLRAAPGGPQQFLDLLGGEIERFSATTGVPCRAEVSFLADLPPAYQETLLRVVGEGLTNVALHARARHAWVLCRKAPGTITVEVGDDGRGFSEGPAPPRGRHYGVRGLRERAALYGGRLDIQSAPGAGTVLRFTLPLGDRLAGSGSEQLEPPADGRKPKAAGRMREASTDE